MSIVSLLGIKVLNNPAKFTDPYEFEITFECLEQLKDDLEWKLTYVGSSRSLEHDQELDSLLVGPIPVGINKFILTADAPSPELIPASELVSVTVILLSCSYKEREFVRVGYYVNNEYDSEELRENPPSKVQVDHIVRNILAEKPRVTRFNIVWDNEGEIDDYPPEQDDIDDETNDDIIDMGVDDDDSDGDDGNDDENDDNYGDNNDHGNDDDNDGDESQIEEKENSQNKLEPAKRQNTINDDDIPEIKRQKLQNANNNSIADDNNDDGEDDSEEDLEALEEADEEELEKEELEDEEDIEEEIEEDIEEEHKENSKGNTAEDSAAIDQEASTPRIESSAPTPTESIN